MTLSRDLGIAVVAMAAIALAGLFAWRAARRRRRKSSEELECLRRLAVNACGRIGLGKIVELAVPVAGGPVGPVLLYDYEVGGVTYEAAQDVGSMPEIAAAAPFLPGQTASVKYDPKEPTNSILACEVWCGVPDLVPSRNAFLQGREEAASSAAKDAL